MKGSCLQKRDKKVLICKNYLLSTFIEQSRIQLRDDYRLGNVPLIFLESIPQSRTVFSLNGRTFYGWQECYVVVGQDNGCGIGDCGSVS